MAFCSACCEHGGTSEVPAVDDFVEEMLPVAGPDRPRSDSWQLEKVAALFQKFDKTGKGMLSAENLFVTFNEMEVKVSEGDAAAMLQAADKNDDGLLDFSEFAEWLCECHVEEPWQEYARQSFAIESMLLLFSKARECHIKTQSALGTVPELPVPDASEASKLVELIEVTVVSDSVEQAVRFREIAAFAKRTTGNCLGLIDSVAKYREKLWKSTEGHREVLGLGPSEVARIGIYGRVHFAIEGALNLVTIHRKALYTLHGINHLFKKLRCCSASFIAALQKRRDMTKVVDSFMTSIDACEKLAYFEELGNYHRAAKDLQVLLQAAEAAQAAEGGMGKLPDLETFHSFRNAWKELKNHYEKTRRLAEGYDDWSIKLWNATTLALYHVCKQYGVEVPGGLEGKTKEATPSIPLLRGFRPTPSVAIP